MSDKLDTPAQPASDVEYWKEEARKFAENADYWMEMARDKDRRLTALRSDRAAVVEELNGLLREASVKLRDVQGCYATGGYACNLLARIDRALAGGTDGR